MGSLLALDVRRHGAARDRGRRGLLLGAGPAGGDPGGDHFVTWPLLAAQRARLGRPLALVHFDAHCDTWAHPGPRRLDHGGMLRYAAEDGLLDPAASIHVGIRTHSPGDDGFATCDAGFVADRGPLATAAAIRARVGDAPVYVTFDVDCLDPAFAPGTGTPVVGGLSTREARTILHALAGLRVVGMDVVEVSPAYDHADVTALAAATVAMDLLYLAALAPPGGR